MSARIARGFTLLEVMVALCILALALSAIAGVSANSFDSSNYAKRITVATLLARAKMLDVEEKLRKDGFGDTEKTYDGDFDKEGYPGFTWRAACRPIEVDVNQLVGAMLGGNVNPEQLPEQVQTFFGAVRGEGSKDLVDSVKGGDLSKVLGGGGFEIIMKQVGETLSKSIREISLEIIWKEDPKHGDSLKFVQYVTTTGRLSVPVGAPVLTDPNAPGARNADTTGKPPLPGAGPLPGGGILPPGLGKVTPTPKPMGKP